MEDSVSKKYAAWIGLGLMYLWVCTFFAWIGFWNSYQTSMKVFGFLGLALVSICGMGILLYVDNIEGELKRIKERTKNNDVEVEYWKEQSQIAIKLLEKERGK